MSYDDCPLCHQLAEHRETRIRELQRAIDDLADEVVDIRNGGRHTDYHDAIHSAVLKA